VEVELQKNNNAGQFTSSTFPVLGEMMLKMQAGKALSAPSPMMT